MPVHQAQQERTAAAAVPLRRRHADRVPRRRTEAEWSQLKAQLVQRFNTKDMGASTWILGMRITRNRKARTITLDQELYVTKALQRYGMQECKLASTPEAVGAAVSVAAATRRS